MEFPVLQITSTPQTCSKIPLCVERTSPCRKRHHRRHHHKKIIHSSSKQLVEPKSAKPPSSSQFGISSPTSFITSVASANTANIWQSASSVDHSEDRKSPISCPPDESTWLSDPSPDNSTASSSTSSPHVSNSGGECEIKVNSEGGEDDPLEGIAVAKDQIVETLDDTQPAAMPSTEEYDTDADLCEIDP